MGDRTRSYLSYVPANLPRGAPLVIVLHASAMNAAIMRKWTGYEFDQWADQEGYAVAYPNGYKHNWNDCRKKATYPAKRLNIDDMGFMQALIAQMAARHGIDAHKVFMFGYSNGGHMALRLALDTPDAVAAVTAVAASLPTPDSSSCTSQGHTARIMLVDGTRDPINPYQGGGVTLFGFGKRGSVLSAQESVRQLAARNGLLSPPVAAQMPHLHAGDPTSVDRLTWANNGVPVTVLYTVHGGGHVVPQPAFRFPRLLGRTTGDLDAPKAALEFFGLLREK
ncbi:MAG: alpha/beta hydrolase family esterase [Stenotrophobium sp.]